MIARICALCGRVCGDYAGGYASVKGFPLCHPNEPGRPDCYKEASATGFPIDTLPRYPASTVPEDYSFHDGPTAIRAVDTGWD